MTLSPPAPARGVWGRLIPAAVLALVTAAVTLSFASTNSPNLPTSGGFAADYVPAEGYVEWSLETALSGDVRRVSEHARSTGFSEVLALPENQASHVLAAVGDDVHTTQFWRETMHVLDGADAGQFTDLYTLTDAGVSLVAGYGGELGWVYNPPLLQLPADVAPGAAWSGSGDAMPFGLATYTHSARATVPSNAVVLTQAERHGLDVSTCLQIDGSTALFDEDGASVLELRQVELWCIGKGRVAAVADLSDGEEIRYAPTAAAPTTSGIATNATAARWTNPARWVTREATVTVDDTFFGATPFSLSLADSPRVTASGLLIAASTTTDDVVALAVSGDSLTRQWYAHPGGDLVTVATVGDVTIVSTGIRQLVAYDARGVRLWQHPTPELVVAPPTGTADGGVVAVGLDGTVTMFDAVTGAIGWTRALGADVDQSAVVAGGKVVTIDRSGTITALEAASGDVAWSVESVAAASIRAMGSNLVTVGDDGWMRLFAVDDGAASHSWRYSGSWRALLAAGSTAVLATDEAIVGVDLSTGEELWRGDGVESAVGDGETIVVFRGSVATAIDEAGSEVASWSIPATYLWSSKFAVPVGNSIVLVHSGSEATIVGAR